MQLFHWSPARNRASIRKNGLTPGRLSRDRVWRSPWVCFARCPLAAWLLVRETKGNFDLWVTDQPAKSVRTSPLNGEKRVMHGIPPNDLWRVGSRSARAGTK